jgi:hypothetical protein
MNNIKRKLTEIKQINIILGFYDSNKYESPLSKKIT